MPMAANPEKHGLDFFEAGASFETPHVVISSSYNDERDCIPNWTKAALVLPESKLSVNLRLDRELVEFLSRQGRGQIPQMQAVLKAYVDAHQRHAK